MDLSATTKVRPVFDGSAKSSTGISLNDLLLPGPNMYPHIEDILLVFCLNKIAFSADISKMFREISLNTCECDLHRFLFRTQSGELITLRMTRLTFGIKSSPFLATKVLLHLADRYKTSHPLAWQCIHNYFYVDDLLTGADSLEEAADKQKQICSLLSKARMTIRKWRTNDSDFRNTIPQELIETADLEIPSAKDSSKALGIHWEVAGDFLHVSAPEPPKSAFVTKRIISSTSAQRFDSLGFFSPFVVIAKVLLQELWLLKQDWDVVAPDSVQQRWAAWAADLPLVTKHPIPRRYYNNSSLLTRSLHGFSDASEMAYGAVVYLRSVFSDGSICCSFVISRARVRPLKTTTIPKLELQAAALLARLLVYVAKTLGITSSNLYPWTDSSIVLSWLRKAPHSITVVFIRNRIAQIQDSLPHSQWRHVPSKSNPVDIASRGSSVPELTSSSLWWSGPSWLSYSEDNWPKTTAAHLPRSLPGLAATVLTTALVPAEEWGLQTRYSNYNHLLCILCWLHRFLLNCSHKYTSVNSATLTSDELIWGRHFLLLQQQQHSYSKVFNWIRSGKSVPGHHCLAGMVVYIDEHASEQKKALIKVTGRVRAEASSKPRELIPLSLKCQLTRLLVRTAHYTHLHPGTSTLMSILGHNYFIPGLRAFLKRLSKGCAVCTQANARPIAQQIGLLPSVRTTPSSTFSIVGIDFAGPFQLKMGYTRKPVMLKAYCCLYVCLSTKAVHLEACNSLSTEDFLAAFERFCGRRGTPNIVYTDNGSNFIGAKSELQDIKRLLHKSADLISHLASSKELKWITIPPRSPHHGGLWEAAVREMKRLLRKMVTPHPLRFDEFATLLVGLEATMNSRPLVESGTTEPDDDLSVTPAHFIIFRPMRAPPSKPASKAQLSHLRRWQLVQRLLQDLWNAWKGFYLVQLQRRSKWRKESTTELAGGDIVYLKDDTLARGRWPLAKVTAVYPGQDQKVRVVDITCRGSIYKKSVQSLVKIYLDEDTTVTTTTPAATRTPAAASSGPPACSGLSVPALHNRY